MDHGNTCLVANHGVNLEKFMQSKSFSFELFPFFEGDTGEQVSVSSIWPWNWGKKCWLKLRGHGPAFIVIKPFDVAKQMPEPSIRQMSRMG